MARHMKRERKKSIFYRVGSSANLFWSTVFKATLPVAGAYIGFRLAEPFIRGITKDDN